MDWLSESVVDAETCFWCTPLQSVGVVAVPFRCDDLSGTGRSSAETLCRTRNSSSKWTSKRVVLCLWRQVGPSVSMTNSPREDSVRDCVVMWSLQDVWWKSAEVFFFFPTPGHLLGGTPWRCSEASCEDKYAIVSSSRHGQVPRDLGLIVVKIFFTHYTWGF